MKNLVVINVLMLLLITSSCKSFLFNKALDMKGIYDDKVSLQKVVGNEKEIVFFPIHHIGTSLYYEDLKHKVDSLRKLNYHFYKEMIFLENKSDSILMTKVAKFQGFANSKQGYTGLLDSLFATKNIKLKKSLIKQPEYKIMGLDSTNSTFTDPSLEKIISFYESKAGEIPINDCDLEYGPFNFYEKCPKYKANKEWREYAMMQFRNDFVIQKAINDTFKKSAIIYGAGHISFLVDSLRNYGFEKIQ